MDNKYHSLLTRIGIEKLTRAQVEGTQVKLTEMAVGDMDREPNEDMASLGNEVWRGEINDMGVDPLNPSWIYSETHIPENVGGFWVREAGIFDEDGDLIVISRQPASYKPMLEDGTAKQLIIRIITEVSNADTVELSIDPSIVMASREYVNQEIELAVTTVEEHYTQLKNTLMANNAGAHNAIYRGKNLGNSYTTAQRNAIQAGTFDDLFIGDYWRIGSVNYRIAAFDYYLGSGSPRTTQHHVVIVPDNSLYTHRMNETNTTEGGYVGSEMYVTGLDEAKSTIKSAFNNRILNHKQYLSNAVAEGEASGIAWFDSEVELMNEVMVFGSSLRVEKNNYRESGIAKGQLPLFQHRHDLITASQYWLRDVSSATSFVFATSNGYPYANFASNTFGVRPAFSII